MIFFSEFWWFSIQIYPKISDQDEAIDFQVDSYSDADFGSDSDNSWASFARNSDSDDELDLDIDDPDLENVRMMLDDGDRNRSGNGPRHYI